VSNRSVGRSKAFSRVHESRIQSDPIYRYVVLALTAYAHDHGQDKDEAQKWISSASKRVVGSLKSADLVCTDVDMLAERNGLRTEVRKLREWRRQAVDIFLRTNLHETDFFANRLVDASLFTSDHPLNVDIGTDAIAEEE